MLQIPSENLTFEEMPVYYRLVAVENGSVCSDESSKVSYYRFDGNQRTLFVCVHFDIMTTKWVHRYGIEIG